LQFYKVAQNQFSKSLVKKQLSTATLSYSPTFIIGLMSTGRLISGVPSPTPGRPRKLGVAIASV